jgi:hypothetical protein
LDRNALERAAMLHAIELSADVETQVRHEIKVGNAPVLALLRYAQAQAASSIVALTDVDPTKPDDVRARQNDVVCFRLICGWIKKIIDDGKDAEGSIAPSDREDFIEILGLDDDDEAQDFLNRGGFEGRSNTHSED